MTTQPGGAAEGDAIAAARRRLPMTEIPGDVTVVGAKRSNPGSASRVSKRHDHLPPGVALL